MEGICAHCGESCQAVISDEGIGITEAWGVISNHHHHVAISDCCHDDVVDEDNNSVSVRDVQEYNDELKAEAKIDAMEFYDVDF